MLYIGAIKINNKLSSQSLDHWLQTNEGKISGEWCQVYKIFSDNEMREVHSACEQAYTQKATGEDSILVILRGWGGSAGGEQHAVL